MDHAVFNGFPARPDVTPLPNIFFTEVLPAMEDVAEIKVVLHIFFLLSRRRGYPRFVSFSELNNDPVIVKGSGNHQNMDIMLKNALDSAVKQGILLCAHIEIGGQLDIAYFINNENEKETITKIMSGDLKIPDVVIKKQDEPVIMPANDIYNLYEQNIGLLTPIIAEELLEAERRYPADWIQDAFREAAMANVRNWKYVHSILKRWQREGKKDGKSVRNTRKERDPDKYIRGKYGHVVRR